MAFKVGQCTACYRWFKRSNLTEGEAEHSGGVYGQQEEETCLFCPRCVLIMEGDGGACMEKDDGDTDLVTVKNDS